MKFNDYKVLLFVTVAALSICGYSLLQKYKDPLGNIVKEDFTYSHINNPDEGIINNPRMASIAVMYDVEGKKFNFQGWLLKHLEENLESGEKITLYWFNACHDLIARRSPVCIEVLGFDEPSTNKGIALYQKSKETSLIFHIFITASMLTVLWVAFLTKGKR